MVRGNRRKPRLVESRYRYEVKQNYIRIGCRNEISSGGKKTRSVVF